MEPLNLAICDDLPKEREALLTLLEQAPIATNCTQFASGEELLEAFRPGKFDLLLMDIYMDGMTGVEAVQKIREMDDAIPIAFTTTSTEHTLESYRLSVLKYLEKPVRQKDLNDLLHLVKLQRDSAPRLAIRQNGEVQRLLLSELFYLEQKGHHVFLYRRDGGTLQLYGKLSDLLPQLEGQPFFCPHKSYCVNLAFVRGIHEEYQSYELADGKMVPISRSNRAKARRAWEDFLFARTRGGEMMEQLFYIFCTTLPSHIIPFVLFWNFQWRSRKAALLVMGASVLCKLGAAAWCITSGVEIRSMEIVFSALNFLLYWYFLRLDFFKLLFTYLLIVDYLLVIRGIAAFLAVRFCQAPPQGWMGSLFCTALYLLTLPPLLRGFRRVSGQVYHTGAPHIWQTIWLVPAILSALTILSTNAWAEQSAGSWLFLAYRGGLLACVLVICYVLLQAIDSLQKQIALEQRLTFERELLEMQMEEEEKRGLLLMETVEQTRQMRHDLRHHLTAIQAMAGDENPRLAAYLSELIQDIPAAVRDYCENPTVNAVVSHYAARCRQEGIAFTARLTVPAQNETLDDRALCVVFANLLENGVEACGRMDGGEKFIRLNSSLEYGVLTITMDNSFDGQARQEGGKFLSSKRAGAPGVGLSSIRAVAKAHQGDARFEAKGTIFLSSVYAKL